MPGPPDPSHSPIRDGPHAALRARMEALLATMGMALALVQGGREIELAGLDMQVGQLCAASLDLPPAEGRTLLPELAALRDAAAALAAAMREQAGQP